MDDQQLLRYSRHILLDEIGIEGQERLLASRVLVIGAGGLASSAALYLASAGVGQITIVDDDTVDLTNLQRQVMHQMDSVGMAKVASARQRIGQINPGVEVIALQERVDAARLDELVPMADVVLDCCDNFATRHAVNQACVRHGVPLVWGAAIRFSGQVGVCDTRDRKTACYACLYPPSAEYDEERCATMGVFAPLVGVIGALQASEALKLLSGAGNVMFGRVLSMDLRDMTQLEVAVAHDPSCVVCGEKA